MSLRSHSSTLAFLAFVLAANLTPAAVRCADGPGLQVLHRFVGSTQGENPAGTLIFDPAGNLYGTTEYGGVNGFYGTVFRLAPPPAPGGRWTESTLYTFLNRGDGARPTDGLILGSSGKLYGTTSDSNAGGYGEIFELTPPDNGSGPWLEKILYSFTGSNDGAYPYGGLISDPAGNSTAPRSPQCSS